MKTETQTFSPRNIQRSLLPVPPLSDLDCYGRRGTLGRSYLTSIYDVLCDAATEHTRLFAFRVDLRLPQVRDYYCLDRDVPSAYGRVDSKAISRFFVSLQEQVEAYLEKRKRQGCRVHPCNLKYIWCRERDSSERPHYHLLILLNNDTYRGLGCYQNPKSLAGMVMKAWASALKCEYGDVRRLVHFPDNCKYWLDRTSRRFEDAFRALFYRASYFAKLDTKEYGISARSFGCSNKKKKGRVGP